MRLLPFLLPLLGAAAQQDQRVLYLTHAASEPAFQELAVAIRGITGISQFSADPAQKSLTLHGTPSQLALAGWLVTQLDQPQPGAPSGVLEYRIADGSGELVRLFYPAYAAAPQDFQEIATIVRSVADIRRLFVCVTPKVLIVRDVPAQLAMAEWLVREIDHPAGVQPAAAPPQFAVPGAADDVMRVFFLRHARNAQDRQEVVTTLRAIANIQRIFVYNSPNAIPMRGTAAQAAVAAWIVDELDRLPGARDAAVHEYRLPADNEPRPELVVRVFYVTGAVTPKDLMDVATRIRADAHIQRLMVYGVRNAITARSNAESIAIAARIVEERNAASR